MENFLFSFATASNLINDKQGCGPENCREETNVEQLANSIFWWTAEKKQRGSSFVLFAAAYTYAFWQIDFVVD
jgi:hypothetical protein